ncbi:MAG: hypothetical protein HY327_07790 [Chloroflexi bacterium]|nr:hypothetical protein [Chloroflexota bacterium]
MWKYVIGLIAAGACTTLICVAMIVSFALRTATVETPTSLFTDAEARTVAIVATYEAQVFPEPLKSQAYRAIIWTMRNRVADGFGGTVEYTDERLLNRYSAFQDHRDDAPDLRALEIAREVLGAMDNLGDPTHGARHFVDHSYWTGTYEQTGSAVKVRGKFSDTDVQRLVAQDKFVLTIEWKTPPDHPRGALFFGLYFFPQWPPPAPIVTPIPTATRKPTATAKPTSTSTPTITPSSTPTKTPTLTPTPTATR